MQGYVNHLDKKILFGSSVIVSEDKGKTWNFLGNAVVPQKEVKESETIKFGKWGILIY
ncbi:MAG: hypothetical protein LBE12_17320 [Planctomycetaceae bacterium]|nr:hypothetical protein [Planctomycetaceae bacterium]